MKKNLALVWRRIPQRYRLIGSQCTNCDQKFFPKRDFCPTCRRKGKCEEFQFSGKGTVVSFTEVFTAPEGYNLYVPYFLAIIQLDEGPLITAQLIDVERDEVKIGLRIRTVFRKVREEGEEGLIHYGFKFTKSD